jgi:endonuclease/exonuclease/phosphatase (EEP) superfamily protein YafD
VNSKLESLVDRWHDRPVRSTAWRTLITFGVLGVVVAIAGLVGHYRTATNLYTVALAAFSPYLGLAALLAAVLFACARLRGGWIGLGVSAALVVWFAVLQAPLFTSSAAPPGHDVTVMTSNLWLGRADAPSVVAAVQRHHVHVLMLEELTSDELARMHAAGLDRLLPYRVVAPGVSGSGTGLWSAHPLTSTFVGYDLGFHYVTAQTRLSAGGPVVSLAAVHAFGPFPSEQTPGWVRDMRMLPAVLHRLAAPALVGGDFNATVDTAQFRDLLTDGYADAADQAGAGFTPTYPADRAVPLIAIDHVLTRGAVGISADSVQIPDTDHRALVATVRVKT